MRRTVISVVAAAALLVALVPAVLAGDASSAAGEPGATPSPAPAASDDAPEPTGTAPGPYDGTIVEDPTFVSGGELATATPTTGLPTGSASLTPPPTDTGVPAARQPAAGPIALVLLIAAGLVALVSMPGSRARRHGDRRRRIARPR